MAFDMAWRSRSSRYWKYKARKYRNKYRKYRNKYRKGFRSGFKYGGTYANEMRGKRKDFGVQSTSTIIFNNEQVQSDTTYALFVINSMDLLFGQYAKDGNQVNNFKNSFHIEEPNLKTGRITSVKHKIQLSSVGSAPLECTSVFLPYSILDANDIPLRQGMYTATAGAQIKSQLLQITTCKQRTISQGTYYWNNPLVRSMTAPSSVQDNIYMPGYAGTWNLNDFQDVPTWRNLEVNPRVFSPTLYVLFQNIQGTKNTSFTVQTKSNFTLTFQASQYKLGTVDEPVADIIQTVTFCSTSNIRAGGANLQNINTLTGIQKALARIVQSDDQNVYLDESQGILLDSSCYSQQNQKYHVKAYVDLQPPPDGTTLLQNQYQPDSVNLPQTYITEWGDYNMTDHPQVMQEINQKYTFPQCAWIRVYDSGSVFVSPLGYDIGACSNVYTSSILDGYTFLYNLWHYNSGYFLNKLQGTASQYQNVWSPLVHPDQVPQSFGWYFNNPTEFSQTCSQAFQECLQAWPFAFSGQNLTQPTALQFAQTIYCLQSNYSNLSNVNKYSYSDILTRASELIFQDASANMVTLNDIITDVTGTPVVIDENSSAYNAWIYDMQQNISTYGGVVLCIDSHNQVQEYSVDQYINVVIYKENDVHLQYLYFLQSIMPALTVMLDHINAWLANVSEGSQLSVGLDLTNLTYEWNQAVNSVAPLSKVNWKEVWTKVKGGFSKAWKWVKDKAIPIVKNVVVPVLPGQVGTVVGAITNGVEAVSNTVDIIANRKKKPASLTQGQYVPQITFKCKPRYCINEQGSGVVPLYEDQQWTDAGNVEVITTSLDDQWQTNQIRNTVDIKGHIERKNLQFLSRARNHLLTAPDGSTDDYPYQLQSSMQIDVDVPSQQKYDIGEIQLIASNEVALQWEEQQEVEQTVDVVNQTNNYQSSIVQIPQSPY